MESTSDVNNQQIIVSQTYPSDLELATFLWITVARLRNRVSVGEPFRPHIPPPGGRKRLWPAQSVHDWLPVFTVGSLDVRHTARRNPGPEPVGRSTHRRGAQPKPSTRYR